MKNSFSTKGIYDSGQGLIDVGNDLGKDLDQIENSYDNLKRNISIMEGYNGSLSKDTYLNASKEIKHKKWVVNVSNAKLDKIDFNKLRNKVNMLKKDGYDLEEVSKKLDSMTKRIEKLLGIGAARDYYFGEFGKYCEIKENSSSILLLHPELEKKKEELKKLCEEKGIKIKITQSVRTVEEQDELYDQGRKTEGEIVTNAKGTDYESNHQWGVAFDVCITEYKDKDGNWVKCNTDEEKFDDSKLASVGEVGKSIGLEWGGDWKDFTDTPHFQLKDYDNLKDQYDEPAQFARTWF